MEKHNEANDTVICHAEVNEWRASEILSAWMKQHPLPRTPEFRLKLMPVLPGESWLLVIGGPSADPKGQWWEETSIPTHVSEVHRACQELVQQWTESFIQVRVAGREGRLNRR